MIIVKQGEKPMKELDRRDFLKLGLLSTAAALSTNSVIAAGSGKDSSGGIGNGAPLQKYVAKKYTNLSSGALKGFSDEQLKAHFALNEDYITKINDLEARIKSFDTNNPDTINYRGWHMEQTSMLNGAVLHE